MVSSQYQSPFSVAKRETIYLDANDPRVRGIMASLTAARAGAEIVIVNGGNPFGGFSFLRGSGPSGKEDGFDPKKPDFTKPGTLDNLDADWVDDTLQITFDFDTSLEENKYVSGFRYRLTANSYTCPYQRDTNLNTSGIDQTIDFTIDKNQQAFGVFQSTFSLLEIQAYDSFGNYGDLATLSLIPTYANDLPAPVITVTAINQGYTVDWNTIAQTYKYISIEEVESNSSTDPGTGYEQIYLSEIKPATIIRPNQNKRWVRARFTDNAGTYGPYSTATSVTPLSPVSVDNTGPDAPTSGTVTAGVDNSAGATIGFNAYVDISWSAVSDSTLRGYRIRFRENGTSDPYSYVDSPGTGTSFRLSGLAIGTVYEVAIASYDEFNNTSSAYFSIGTAQATGTPFIGKNVTTVGYFGASATGDTGTFKFGYGVQDSGGVKRGLVFNSNNYWYIDSAQSALFKLGGDANNYIQWDGANFIVQGDLRAKKGNFSGNVEIQLGGSLYSGALDLSGNLDGAGFILNNDGLTFNSSTVNGITTIAADTGLFTTSSANIGGWDVTSSAISKTSGSGTVTLDSSSAEIRLTSATYTAGIATPDTNAATDIVFWAGGTRSTSASFYVTGAGILNAEGANLTGTLSTASGSMKFGELVYSSGGTDYSGIHIDANDYWYSSGSFSFASGLMYGTSTAVNFNLNDGNSEIKFLNMPNSDFNGWAGDPTVTLDEATNKLVKGRRFIYQSLYTGTGGPGTVYNFSNGEGKYLTGDGEKDIKSGDIVFIQES